MCLLRDGQISTVPTTVSVLMPAYNAGRYLRQSVHSVLQQTFEDFELIVINDASTDDTAALLRAIQDRRLRVLTNDANLGIVGSLNRALGEARGRYIARTDADDICHPCRFARQVAFLDAQPTVALVGSGIRLFENGRLRPARQSPEADPGVLRWLLHIGNPVVHPSMMFRAEAARQLDHYLSPAMQYAEDFDFLHRMLHKGVVAVMPDTLMVYRLHEQNATRVHKAEMVERAAAVLGRAYAGLLGRVGGAEATLVADHLFAGVPVANSAALHRLGQALDLLLDTYLARHPLDAAQRALCERRTAQAWWRVVEGSVQAGRLGVVGASDGFSRAHLARPPLHRLAEAVVRGAVPGKAVVRRQLARLRAARGRHQPSQPAYVIAGQRFSPEPPDLNEVPSLTVVVDTEAEFDWDKPFGRSLTSVQAMAGVEELQETFDGYGLCPVYVVDYAVATQPAGQDPLRRILARHGCAIGAHLHPWITPPFEETLNERNSYSGNLPAALEEAKTRTLVQAIKNGFGVKPLFFKAGRYGLGPHTLDILGRLGFEVDFSIMPLTDLRGRGGSADFRFAGIGPARAGTGQVLSVPMTRAQIGALAPLPPGLHGMLHSPLGKQLRLPGLLSWMRLANTVTLTPEGVTAAEQVALLRALVAHGHRRLVLHYHSPSLVPGNTPYVRTDADLQDFKARVAAVCRCFFEDIGGVPGHPASLLPEAARPLLWPGTALAGSMAL